MKTIKFFQWMLTAAVVLGLSMSVTSCKDDDDDDNKGTEQKKDDVSNLDTDDARVAFRWLCALTNTDVLTEDWASKTYEPTVGEVSPNNEFTRIVVVNSLEEAKEHFSKYADLEVSQLGTSQTVNGGAAGTMTWTPSKAGAQNMAEVAVNSRIMPHLQKIVYCTEEQKGDNGLFGDSMKGVAYYRFGDVVRDSEGYYWVCVRPSFAPDKGDSHWINIFNAGVYGNKNGQKVPMLEANIYRDYSNKAKYNNHTILLPTQLAYDREHIYNLSNLIWALLNPVAYRTETEKVGNNGKGLGGFEYGYHGEKFLKAVGQYWEENIDGGTIWQKLFNCTGGEMKELSKLNFFYYGYKWWWGNTADMWRYKSTQYLNTYAETGSMSKDKEDIDVVTEGFDITRYAGDPDAAYVNMKQFEGREGTWVIRYKRGDKLSNTGKYDPYNKIAGCDDIYRYNQKKNVTAGQNEKQETENSIKEPEKLAIANVKVGNVLGDDGNFYESALGLSLLNVTPVAIVACVKKNGVVEDGTTYNALALALHSNDYKYHCHWGEKGKECGGSTANNGTSVTNYPLNGLAMTKQLAAGCGANHSHPAAMACSTYESNTLNVAERTEKGFSDWFLPSVSQWKMILEGFGVTGWNNGFFMKSTDDIRNPISAMYSQGGVNEFFDAIWSAELWSSTPYDKDMTNYLVLNWKVIAGREKDQSAKLFPVIAFKVQ